jgi:hypothetical protein
VVVQRPSIVRHQALPLHQQSFVGVGLLFFGWSFRFMVMVRSIVPLSQMIALLFVVTGFSQSSMAGLTSVYYANAASGVDQAFENQGGFLQTNYNLPNTILPNGTTSSTVLPQLERAIAQLAGNNANGLHVPTAATGIPGQSYSIAGGGTGVGVWQALTNASQIQTNGNGGTASGTFANFVYGSERTVGFELKRVGNVVSFVAGSDLNDPSVSRTWVANAASYLGTGNAIEFRIRSGNNTTVGYSNLRYTDSVTNSQSIQDFTATDGNVAITLFEGVTGDFSLTGNFAYNPDGINLNAWNSQIKLLEVPTTSNVVPEPASMAVFGLLSGSLGWARWRRRKA